MKKTYHPHHLKAKRSYSSEELAETLHVHRQTVRQWHKAGLRPLEGSLSPLLFLGSEVKDFIKKQNNKHKVKMQPDELYCLGCKKPVKPLTTTVTDRGFFLGNGSEAILTQATCPDCGCQLNRYGSKALNQPITPVVINREPQQPLYPSLSNI